MKRRIRGLLTVVAMVIGAFAVSIGVSAATTWTVDDDGPADFSTIQAAVDAASSGDTISIGPGTYCENLVIENDMWWSILSLTFLGAGIGQTTVDGGGADIVLRVDSNVEVTISGMTIQNGASPTYPDGVAFWEGTVLVNLQPVQMFKPQSDLDANFQLLVGNPPTPVVSSTGGVEQYFAVWGQSFKVPLSATPQTVSGFRFLLGDGLTPAGAGTGYLFEDSGYGGAAADLPTSDYVASGPWSGSYYDLSGDGFSLTPGKTYWFYSDTAITVGAVNLGSARNCGGGINNRGVLCLTDSAVIDNIAETNGAGISNLAPDPVSGLQGGSLTITNSLVANNSAGGWLNEGGGIFTTAGTVLNIFDSAVQGNSAHLGGGIFAGGGFGSAQVTITDSIIAQNSAYSWGGGILNSGSKLTITSSTISGNQAGHKGGGILNAGSGFGVTQLYLQRSTVSHNSVTAAQFYHDGGGGIFNGDLILGQTTYAGAYVSQSTIHNNEVVGGTGGGVKSYGTFFELTNSTVSGNSATLGGGIATCFGSSGIGTPEVMLMFGTIASNTGGGIYNEASVSFSLEGTIVADNGGADCVGNITSHGRNLDSDGTCNLSAAGDISETNPLLGPLQDNGGWTWTHAPLPGSPVIDAPFGGYPYGNAYLSGGAGFVLQQDSDGNFQVWTNPASPKSIVSNTGGAFDNYNYWGQSFLIPSSQTDLDFLAFNFLRADGSSASGAGIGYLFDSEYIGTPADLDTAMFVASGSWNGSVYDFSVSGFSFVPGTKYWFYSDQPVTVGVVTPPICSTNDQRGIARPQDGDGDGIAICDIGAVEVASPIADAGGPYLGIEGSPVVFDGSNSYDPDGTIVSYEWDFGDGHTGSGETPAHTYASTGTYIVSLTATDDEGRTYTDTTTATVRTPTEAIQDLISVVEYLGLDKGMERALVSQLQSALRALEQGHANVAASVLRAFISAVRALKGNRITDVQADELIEVAQMIIDAFEQSGLNGAPSMACSSLIASVTSHV